MKNSAWLAAVTMVAACAPAHTQPARAISIDDARVGQALNHIDYTGTWEHVGGRADGRFRGTSTRSRNAGDAIVVPFDGVLLHLFGVRGPNGGSAVVAIDGQYVGTADFYAPQKHTHVLVFASPLLTPGTHTLGIVVHGDPSGSKRVYVNIDEVEVLNRE
jgi:hypothetical protein